MGGRPHHEPPYLPTQGPGAKGQTLAYIEMSKALSELSMRWRTHTIVPPTAPGSDSLDHACGLEDASATLPAGTVSVLESLWDLVRSPMSAAVFVVVVLAAFLHATWNALVKGSSDKHVGMLGISVGRVPDRIAAASVSHRCPTRRACPGFSGA